MIGLPEKQRFWKKRKQERTASEVLEAAIEGNQADMITLGELISALHERGFGLLMMIFVLPNCVPVPIPPGMSSLFAIPLFFLSAQMMMGKDAPWLPGWLSRRRLRRAFLANMILRASPRLKRIEKLLRPRLFFASSSTGERVFGIFCLLFTISIAVPLPLTNFVPGVGILVMSLGLLSKDGLIMIGGSLIGFAGLLLSVAVVLFGVGVVKAFLGV